MDTHRSRDAVVGMLLGVTLNSAAILLAARALGAEGRGIMVTLTLIPTAVNVLAGGGLALANVHDVAARRLTEGVALGNSIIWSLVVPSGLAGLFALTASLVSLDGLGTLSTTQISIALLLSSTVMMYQQASGVVQGRSDFRTLLRSRGTQGGILLVGTILASMATREPVLFFLVWCFSYGATAILLVVLATVRERLSASTAALRESLRYGVRGMWAQTWELMNYRGDQFILASIASPAILGVYSVGAAVTELLLHVPNALSQVVFAESATRSDSDDARRIARESGLAFALLLPVGGVLFVGSLLLPWILGSDYTQVRGVVAILAVPTAALAASRLLSGYLMGIGRPDLPGWGAAASLATTLVADLILVPRFGALGAGLGAALGYWRPRYFSLSTFARTTGTRALGNWGRGMASALGVVKRLAE